MFGVTSSWISRLLLVASLLSSASCAAVTSYVDTDCELDHDATNPVLEECLKKGEDFIREYFRHLDRGKIDDFNTCYEFKEFGSCIRDLWKRCQTIQQVTHKHWKPVVDLMTCSCNTTINKHECQHERQCLETEFKGVLVKRCDELYDFNVIQGTRDKCVFLRNRIMCKTSLAQTACGENVGKTAYAMSKINNKKIIEKSRCYISLDEPYDGFRYTNSCSRDFKEEMNLCYNEHLLPYISSFKESNDLIVDGKHSDLKKMCSGYREYKHCSRAVRSDCRQGVNLIYEQNGSLRSMILKLEYICKEAKIAYQQNLQCMQNVLDKDELSKCNRHWNDLEPYLNNITSYEFYCQAHNPNTKGMVVVLEELRHCFEVLFSLKCNPEIGSVMSELIRRAFDDPFYLRFAYRADCHLHKESSENKDKKTKRHQYSKYARDSHERYRSTLRPRLVQHQQHNSDTGQPDLTSGTASVGSTALRTLSYWSASALLTISFIGQFGVR